MAKIQLVIEIEERLYKNIIDNDIDDEEFEAMDMAFCDAKPLPKGHGDLIDRRELKKEVYTVTEWNGDIHRIIYETSVDDAKPIIEADGGER